MPAHDMNHNKDKSKDKNKNKNKNKNNENNKNKIRERSIDGAVATCRTSTLCPGGKKEGRFG